MARCRKNKSKSHPQGRVLAAQANPCRDPHPWQNGAAIGLIALGGIFLLLAARGELWFDEILSFQWAANAGSPWQIIELFRHDNNHPLNSLWLYLLGEGHPALFYRLPAVLGGILSFVLIYALARTLSARMALLPLFLAVFSFPLLLYASEARGFSMAVAASLAVFFILLRRSERPGPGTVLLFFAITFVGLLSHGSFLIVLLALFLWQGTMLVWSQHTAVSSSLLRLVAWFTAPSILAISYYFYFLRPMLVAGGPEFTLSAVLQQFFGFLFGLPATGFLGFLALALGAALLLLGLLFKIPGLPHSRLLFFFLLLLVPALSLWAGRAEFVYFRYFLVLAPFFYLLAGVAAERLEISKSKWFTPLLILIMLGYLLGQSPRISDLLVLGRGSYTQALAQIASNKGENVVISDHDMRNGMIVEFHRRQSPALNSIRYFPEWEYAGEPALHPGWIITHSLEENPDAPPAHVEFRGRTYALVDEFPTAPVSGFHWFLYQHQPNNPN